MQGERRQLQSRTQGNLENSREAEPRLVCICPPAYFCFPGSLTGPEFPRIGFSVPSRLQLLLALSRFLMNRDWP